MERAGGERAGGTPRAVALLLAAIGLLLVLHAFAYNATADDAFITFRYACNVAAGDGPRWNPGELPVEGYTSFVWMLLMTGPCALGAPALLANVLGVVAGLAGLVLAWRLARRLTCDPKLALLAPLLLALDRTYAGWSTGGLETSLFTTLILLGYTRWLEEATDATRTPLAGVVFALATLTRPEGAMYFGLAMLGSLVLWRQGRLHRRAFVLHVVAFAVIVGAHLAWRLAYYGLPLPNTFYTKVNGLYWTSGLAYLLLFARHHALLPLAFAAGFAGWIAAWRTPSTRDAAGLALAFLAALLAYLLYIGGDIFEFRFMHVASPFTAIGATLLVARLRRRALRLGVALVMIACTGATTPLAKLSAPQRLFTIDTPIAMRVETLEVQDQPRPAHRQVAAWLAAIKRPGDLLAIDGAGVVPFYAAMSTLDILGLNDAVIGRRTISRRGWPGHEKRPAPDYIQTRAPTFFVPNLHQSIGEGRCADLPLCYGLGTICVRLQPDLYWTFGTFRDLDELAAELRARGAEVISTKLVTTRPARCDQWR